MANKNKWSHHHSRRFNIQKLDEHFPGLKARYVREFHNWYEFSRAGTEPLVRLFHETCERHGILHDNDQLFHWMRELEKKSDGEQLSLLDSL